MGEKLAQDPSMAALGADGPALELVGLGEPWRGIGEREALRWAVRWRWAAGTKWTGRAGRALVRWSRRWLVPRAGRAFRGARVVGARGWARP